MFFFVLSVRFFGCSCLTHPSISELGRYLGMARGLYDQALGGVAFLGGGFRYFLFSTRKLGKISNLTNIFQMG